MRVNQVLLGRGTLAPRTHLWFTETLMATYVPGDWAEHTVLSFIKNPLLILVWVFIKILNVSACPSVPRRIPWSVEQLCLSSHRWQ